MGRPRRGPAKTSGESALRQRRKGAQPGGGKEAGKDQSEGDRRGNKVCAAEGGRGKPPQATRRSRRGTRGARGSDGRDLGDAGAAGSTPSWTPGAARLGATRGLFRPEEGLLAQPAGATASPKHTPH